MKYKLEVHSIWHPGKRVDADGNPHQEDSIFPAHNAATAGDRLFILCDGMGGHEAGEVASATVCEAMSKSVLAAVPDPEGTFSEEIFKQALADAYDALDKIDDGTTVKKPGTTLTFLKLYDEGCLIAHMGDSRVYHIRSGKTAEKTRILFRTEDHSLVNDLVKVGELTPEEARHSTQKNIITRAMQPNTERRSKADIHLGRDIAPGDYFYLCSDGMLENMDDQQLCYFFSDEAGDDKDKVKSLLNATRENKDNHSAIIVHILGVEGRPEPLIADDDAPLMGELHDNQAAATKTAPKAKHNGGIIIGILAALIVLAGAIYLLRPKTTDTPATEEPAPAVQHRPKTPYHHDMHPAPPHPEQQAMPPAKITGQEESGTVTDNDVPLKIKPSKTQQQSTDSAQTSNPATSDNVTTSDESKVGALIGNAAETTTGEQEQQEQQEE